MLISLSQEFPNKDLKTRKFSYDSRNIHPGDIFVAIKGLKLDGHDFIDEAITKGAAAIVHQNKVEVRKIVPYLQVDNTRKWLAKMACIINKHPSKHLTMLGITGTNGKTTTSYILKQIIKKAGFKPGIIGTISNNFKSLTREHPSTTPESLELQGIMKHMLKSKITHVAMEVSSHALDMHRIDGCRFDIAIFTNLTQDHLDYHLTMRNYWDTKQKLFHEYLRKDGTAIINTDDYRGQNLAQSLSKKIKVISTGNTNKSDIWPTSLVCNHTGTQGKIITPKGKFTFRSSLLGSFNVNNILSATGAAIAIGIPLTDISSGINTTPNIPGRLELLKSPSRISVYVDYAHTPDALKNVLKTIRSLTKGQIIIVFGCGGERDYSKRAVMGEIAAKFSDLCIITSDNPRFENVNLINEQIVRGIRQICTTYENPKKLLKNKLLKNRLKNKSYMVIPNRKKAISIGILAANTKDTVIITGKGHETCQVIGDKAYEFDDKKEAEKILESLDNYT